MSFLGQHPEFNEHLVRTRPKSSRGEILGFIDDALTALLLRQVSPRSESRQHKPRTVLLYDNDHPFWSITLEQKREARQLLDSLIECPLHLLAQKARGVANDLYRSKKCHILFASGTDKLIAWCIVAYGGW